MTASPDAPEETGKRKSKARRPGPSARFLAISWGVALLALLMMGGVAVLFSRNLVNSERPPTPAR